MPCITRNEKIEHVSEISLKYLFLALFFLIYVCVCMHICIYVYVFICERCMCVHVETERQKESKRDRKIKREGERQGGKDCCSFQANFWESKMYLMKVKYYKAEGQFFSQFPSDIPILKLNKLSHKKLDGSVPDHRLT